MDKGILKGRAHQEIRVTSPVFSQTSRSTLTKACRLLWSVMLGIVKETRDSAILWRAYAPDHRLQHERRNENHVHRYLGVSDMNSSAWPPMTRGTMTHRAYGYRTVESVDRFEVQRRGNRRSQADPLSTFRSCALGPRSWCRTRARQDRVLCPGACRNSLYSFGHQLRCSVRPSSRPLAPIPSQPLTSSGHPIPQPPWDSRKCSRTNPGPHERGALRPPNHNPGTGSRGDDSRRRARFPTRSVCLFSAMRPLLDEVENARGALAP